MNRLFPKKAKSWIPWAVSVVVFVAQLPAFYHIAQKRIEKFNTGGEKKSEIDQETVPIVFHYDQHVYLNNGRMMKRADYDHMVPRHRTPGYSFLVSFLYSDSDAYPVSEGDPRRVSEAYFSRAKQFNIITTIVCLIAIFGYFAYLASPQFSLLFASALAWFIFIFRAPFTQPEVLFYTLLLFSFVLLGQQLVNPTWRKGIVGGFVLAATFMMKAAVLPLVALFVGCFGLLYLVKLFSRRPKPKDFYMKWWINVARGASVPLLFVLLLSPYLFNTWKKYGNPFWSVHSQHFMWLESREDKHQWRHLIGMLEKYGGNLPEDAPSKERYFANHTLSDFFSRSQEGATASLKRIKQDYQDASRFLVRRLGRIFLVVVFCCAVCSIPPIRDRLPIRIPISVLSSLKTHWILILYFLLFAGGYLLLYGSYQLIGAGPRLILSMFPVFIFSLWFLVEKFAPTVQIRERTIPTLPIFQGILAISVILGIIHTLNHEVMRVPGGG